MCFSRSLSSIASRNLAHSPIGIAATSAMDRSLTVTLSTTGLRRRPSHDGHGISRM